METNRVCLECQAKLREGETCEDHFHQMLYWENEFPGHGEVHHLTVLCYYLQHPSLYSPDGLRYARQLLDTFLKESLDPTEARQRMAEGVSSSQRNWKISGRPGARGAYARPVHWEMHAGNVIAAGSKRYKESVRAWAQSIAEAIQESESS